MIRGKIRPNVLIIAGMIWFLTLITLLCTFGFIRAITDLFPDSEFWTGAVVGSIVTLFVTLLGVGYGGLVTIMSTVAQDAPPDPAPNVPAYIHEKALDKLS